ncbi:MAG TPA: hypothetical protein VFE32_04680 [Puia sp.]|jgi:hypothetical protein|nr:hypothetical protein [Puia sp.]
MNFYYDIIDKTARLFDKLDTQVTDQPLVQNTSYSLNSFALSTESFFCDLYAPAAWLNNNRTSLTPLLDSYELRELTCGYISFNLVGSITRDDSLNNCRPLVCLVIAGSALNADPHLLSQLQFYSGNYSFMIILNDDLPDAELARLRYDCAGKVLALPLAGVSRQTLSAVLETKLLLTKEKMKDLQTLAALRFFRPRINAIYRQAAADKTDLERLAARKDQLADQLKKIENDRSIGELVSKAKLDLQTELRNLDRQFKRKYTRLLSQNIGAFSILVDQCVAQLDRLDEKDSNDRIPKKLTAIPPDFIQYMQSQIAGELRKEFTADLAEMAAKTRELKRQMLNALKIDPAIIRSSDPMSTAPASAPDIDPIIQSYVDMNRLYQGEIPKVTFQTYLMQVRQQTFFVFMLLTLVSPLLTAPSIIWKDYFDNHDDTKRSFQGYITDFTCLMGLFSLGLAIYYFVDLKKKIPLMKEEIYTKELTKARNTLTSEGKRIFNEATRDWLNGLSNWLNEINEGLSARLDDMVTEYNKARRTRFEQAEKEYQSALQEYNQCKQRNDNTERILSGLVMDYQNTTTQIENKIVFYLK